MEADDFGGGRAQSSRERSRRRNNALSRPPRGTMTRRSILLIALLAILLPGCCRAGSLEPWQLPSANTQGQLEREQVLVAAADHLRAASALFNGRRHTTTNLGDLIHQGDLFQCAEPTRHLFEQFVATYNRTFDDHTDKLTRWTLFSNTQRRIIMLNRIVQNEILNQSNYQERPQAIGNYYFITPLGTQGPSLWYADLTDCELGLVKYFLFELIYLIDSNQLATAYKVALENQHHLPLLTSDGWEQLANILLVRLYDRFQGDQQMEQLFRWPLYLKRLAAFAYNRRQAAQPDRAQKLPLVAFAYPAYFKDLKYNLGASNRTWDNLAAHEEHERFIKRRERRIGSRQERNKRLAIFRQRWSLVNELNELSSSSSNNWQNNVTIQPEWLRAHREPPYTLPGSNPKSAALESDDFFGSKQDGEDLKLNQFRLTQFSDLTDAEFQAFITNDFSLLGENSKEAADYIEANFPPHHLDERYRWELAEELELRRLASGSHTQQKQAAPNEPRPSLKLARRVVDELVGDVGLPFGPVAFSNIDEAEQYRMFTQVAAAFQKPYAASSRASAISESEMAEERARRYQQFKQNYGRFKAWFVREGWHEMDEARLVSLLRLADMSWLEIKLSLFKLCCLTGENLEALARSNASLHYLASNQFLCRPMSKWGQLEALDLAGEKAAPSDESERELAALELYYYYSVHFNKHHLHMDNFYQALAVFSHNIDQLRRLSCPRALTLYQSLLMKRPDSLSSIDVTDPRRQYTDDLNLDRYRYFSVPNLSASPASQQQQPPLAWLEEAADSDQSRRQQDDFLAVEVANSKSETTPSRAGVSYRRGSFFSTLVEGNRLQQGNNNNNISGRLKAGDGYMQTLISLSASQTHQAHKYRQNHAARIYELVMQRYRYCTRTVRNRDPEPARQRQVCQSTGSLGVEPNENQWLVESSKLQKDDQCAFYFLGLEPWNAGLIRQQPTSAALIQTARCL